MQEPKIAIEKLMQMPNIAQELDEDYLDKLGSDVVNAYTIDLNSRHDWEMRNEQSIKLALQVVEKKTFPWVGASNVKFPLITISALQFLSRISVLTKGNKIVKTDVIGPDSSGEETKRAHRIAAHMSYQLTEEDFYWRDDDEKTKFSCSIMGSAFKKSYFDRVAGINISEFVPASNFVVSYYTKNLDGKTRCTHLIPMQHNDIRERVLSGLYIDYGDDPVQKEQKNVLQQTTDKVQGTTEPALDPDTPIDVLEQHLWLDLDGDNYREPYIVTVRKDNRKVLRVVARFYEDGIHRVNDASITEIREMQKEVTQNFTEMRDNNALTELQKRLSKYDKQIENLQKDPENYIIRIDPENYFTRYIFIPDPNGGFYGLGLGSILGPINASVDTALNQLIDTATLSNTAGGILGRGVKLKAGNLEMNKWTPIDSPGDDIRKNVMRWPVSEPSPILFQLIEFLVNYGERITGATDIMTGISPGQNTPAETSRNTIEQGMKVFSGIYRRMFRSFQDELRKLYRLNVINMGSSAKFFNLSSASGEIISLEDYRKADVLIRPAADPESASDAQRQQKAVMVSNRASAVPGYNIFKTERDLLEAFDIQEAEQVYPDPSGPNAVPPPVNPKVQVEQMKREVRMLELQQKERQMESDALETRIRLGVLVEESNAKVNMMQAEAIKMLSEANGVDTGHDIAILDAQIAAEKLHRESLLKAIDLVVKRKGTNEQISPMDTTTGNSGLPEPTDTNTGGNQGELGAQ